jgi:hypothetical protein
MISVRPLEVVNPATIDSTIMIRKGIPIVNKTGINTNRRIIRRRMIVRTRMPSIASPNDRIFFTASVNPTLKSFNRPLGDGAAELVSVIFLSSSGESG